MHFKHKQVLVTGGTGALGRAVCSAFLAEGATVTATYILDQELDSLPVSLKDNAFFLAHRLNLTQESEVVACLGKLPCLDVLVNVAGGFAMGPFAEMSQKDWAHMFEMNLTTAFLTCREALKHMQRQDQGRIINVGAFAASQTPPGMAAYTSSKAGLLHLTGVLAEETLATKITVNAVLPSIMDTAGNRRAMPDADFSSWVPVENAADTIVYLARDSSWHVTGALIPLRGHC